MTLLLLLACGNAGWTREAALSPLLDRLDRDTDGKVSREEYDRVAYAAPSFDEADEDHDGALSVLELQQTIFRQDPNTFDGALDRTPPDLSLGPGVSGTMDTRQRMLWEVFSVLREDALSAREDVLVPDPWTIQLAAMTGRMDSPESRKVLADLERAWNVSAGLTFPSGLQAALPAALPAATDASVVGSPPTPRALPDDGAPPGGRAPEARNPPPPGGAPTPTGPAPAPGSERRGPQKPPPPPGG